MITTSAQQIARRGMEHGADLPDPFWELIEQYRETLIGQAAEILGGRADAEDVVQETFCQAFKERDRMAQAESICAWLLAINRCNALDRAKSGKRAKNKVARKFKELPERSVTTGGFSGIELRESLAKLVATLPPGMRAVVALRYWEHLSYAEIAQRLNIPQGTVGRLLREASTLMFEKLKDRLELPDAPPTAGDAGNTGGAAAEGPDAGAQP